MSGKRFDSEKIEMPAGEYYIGDLCYVLNDRWDEFCKITISDACDEGKFSFKDGVEFLTFNTAYGDGCYQDQEGRRYGVDAGLIGAILVSNISEDQIDEVRFGNVVIFNEPWVAYNEGGNMHFSNINVNTKEEEEHYDYDEEYEI